MLSTDDVEDVVLYDNDVDECLYGYFFEELVGCIYY